MSGQVIPFAEGGGGGTGSSTLPVPPIPPKGGPPPATTAQPNVSAVRSPNDGIVQDGSELWQRKWELTVGTPSGQDALDLSLLDFEFNVQQDQFQPPWIARIKIWNLGMNVITRMNKELTKVQLKAGYQQPSKQYDKLFQGQINYYKYGRENATDTFVEIFATTYDTGVNASVVNTWLPAGYTTTDEIKALQTVMAPYGIALGQLPDTLDKTKKPRGRLLFGMARDYLRDIERTEKGRFFIDRDGKLHLLKEGEALKMGSATVPVLTPRSGLIGVPTQILGGGVEVQTLLNPAITPGTQIHVDVKSVAQFHQVNTETLVADAFKLDQSAFAFSNDGYFIVGSVRHQGQNRGNPWYSHIVTQKALPDVGPKTSAS